MTKYLRDRPFLIVRFSHHPLKGVDTKQKGWMTNPKNIETREHVSVENRVLDRHASAQLIIDILDAKVIRNTTLKDDHDIMEHYVGRYAETIKSSLQVWARQQVEKELKTV